MLTFALGLPAGVISVIYLLYEYAQFLLGHQITPPLPVLLLFWMILAAFLWLNTIFIGAWYNISTILRLPPGEAIAEVAKVIAVAPVAGILASSAAFWAILRWCSGKRAVSWKPTPKTPEADKAAVAE